MINSNTTWKLCSLYLYCFRYLAFYIPKPFSSQVEYLTEVNVVWAAGTRKDGLELSDLTLQLKKVLGIYSLGYHILFVGTINFTFCLIAFIHILTCELLNS